MVFTIRRPKNLRLITVARKKEMGSVAKRPVSARMPILRKAVLVSGAVQNFI